MAYKPKRSGTKKSAPNARARRAASRAANGVNTSRTRAEREPVVDAPVRVGTRAIREEEVAEAIAPVLEEFSLVLEGLKISGPAANRTVPIRCRWIPWRRFPVRFRVLSIVRMRTTSSSPTSWRSPRRAQPAR